MKTEQIEVNELIARRVPPGDNWILVADPNDTIHIDETYGSFILSRGNVINVLIQITNLVLIATDRK